MAYNNSREMFPANLVAGLFQFAAASLFEVTRGEEREGVKVQF